MIKLDGLDYVKSKINSCEQCELCKTRKNVVFGAGNTKAKIMFIGEAPGENEDFQGQPFVGKAGKLLDKILETIDLSREKNIYITNIVKCRPPNNRDPLQEEQDACIGYLYRQIDIIKPKVIVALGRIAAKRFIDENFKVTYEHGKWFEKNGVYLMATYHPAALLRFANRKEDAMKDFISLREKLQQLDLYK